MHNLSPFHHQAILIALLLPVHSAFSHTHMRSWYACTSCSFYLLIPIYTIILGWKTMVHSIPRNSKHWFYFISSQEPTETSQEIEMEDYPIQKENQSFLQLCARLFPSNQSSVFRGRHSLFQQQQRQVSMKGSPLSAAITAIMKR